MDNLNISELTRKQQKIKLYLAKLAARHQTITYADLCSKANLAYFMDNPHHRNLLSEDLGEIAREEVYKGHPMLSCIVVEKITRFPSKGFYDWAENLYDFTLSNDAKRERFFIEELKSTFALWSSLYGKQEIQSLVKDLNRMDMVS